MMISVTDSNGAGLESSTDTSGSSTDELSKPERGTISQEMTTPVSLSEQRKPLYPVDFAYDVLAFHAKFGLLHKGLRALPKDLLSFRMRFMEEELLEYETAAVKDGNSEEQLEEQLDAMLDLIYVALGTLIMQGFPPSVINEAWRRIQEKNMQKVRVEKALDSKRGSQYDVIKPPGWVPPSHRDLVKMLLSSVPAAE